MRKENEDRIVNIDQKPEFRSATCEFPSLKRLSRVACFFVYANSKERIRIFGCKNKCETILCVRYVWSADKNVWQPQCNEQRGPFETSFFFFLVRIFSVRCQDICLPTHPVITNARIKIPSHYFHSTLPAHRRNTLVGHSNTLFIYLCIYFVPTSETMQTHSAFVCRCRK